MDDLATWLEARGLGKYAEVLAKNDVDLEILPRLSDSDLKDLGFSLGHRRKLLAALQETANQDTRAHAAGGDEAEHRQLTVMFCDMAGSTELSRKLDPEELRDVMRRYHEAVARAVAAHRGHVAKLLGDGVMAYFGWPLAQEDQAEQAIRAALEGVAAAGEISAAGQPLAARAGVATGRVVVGDAMGELAPERGAVAGEAPSLAARLQALAKPGEVVTDEATRRLAGGAIRFEDRGPKRLKGFAEPVPAWRVTGTVRTSRFEAAHGAALTEFVGRDNEIRLFLDRWGLARGGEGQILLISGEAGIGKSRILREAAGRVQGEGCTILTYQCSPHETNAAFHPIIAEIEASAGIRPNDPPERRLDKLERHLGDFAGDADDAVPLIAALLSLPVDRYPPIEMAAQRRKQRTITLLIQRLTRLTADRALLILIEDVHWIDASSLEVLDALVDEVGELAIMAVITYRPEFAPQWSGRGHVTAHSISRLGRSDGSAIAERVAGGKALPDEVLARIVAQTDGIPLFVEELTKAVLEAGFLEEQTDRYVLTGPLPALAIPATLQDSLMARLDRLAPVKRVIQAAACIGREFGTDLLGAALAMDSEMLEGAIDRLLDAELIFRRSGVADERYIFKHALVQDAAYASLMTSARRALHERLALALEKTREPDPLELARHYFEAGANPRAADLYLTAGRRLLEGNALPEAIGALETGLRAVSSVSASPERDRTELDLRVALGTASMANFGWAHPSVSEALEPAFPLARSLGDMDALGSILWGLWVHYQTRTNFPRAHVWLTELKAVATANADSDLPVVYDMSAGCQSFWEADYRRALDHTDHLKTIYDRGRHARITAYTNHDPLVFSQHWAGSFADWISGYPDRSVARLDEAVALAREIGHPFNLMFALTAGSTVLFYLGEIGRLLAHCDEAEAVIVKEALGPFSQAVCVCQWRGAAMIGHGEFADGYALSQQGNAFWNASDGRVCNAMMRSWLMLGLQGMGRIDEAMALNADNIAHCRETGDRYMEPECLRLQGELALAADPSDPEAAERLFREAITLAKRDGARSWELRAATSLARLLRANDRGSEVVACLEPVLGWFTEGLETADLRQAAALLDELG